MEPSAKYKAPLAACLLLASFAASQHAFAALPFVLKPRPRVYVSAETIARLKTILAVPVPLTDAQFPATGSLRFSVNLSPPTGDTFAPVFDSWDSNRRHLMIRHYQSIATGTDDCPLQVAFMDSSSGYVAAWSGHLTCGQWHELSVSWNNSTKKASVTADSAVSMLTFTRDFAPDGQRFVFGGSSGDVFDEIFVSNSDSGGTPVALFSLNEGRGDRAKSTDAINTIQLSGEYQWVERSPGQFAVGIGIGSDPGRLRISPQNELLTTFLTLKDSADRLTTQLTSGGDIYAPEPVEAAHPLRFTTTAKHIGLAWLLTGEPQYRTALFVLADQILAAPPAAGNDFSRAGRAGALGFIYDWLHSDIRMRIHAASGKTYQHAMYDYVRATALTDGVFFCGNTGPFASEWKCRSPKPAPWATGTHADYNNSLFAAAVLAMVDDFPAFEELADVLLQGDRDVVAPFREYVSVDGAHHFGYDYGATYTQLFGALGWMSATDVDPLRPYMGNLPFRVIYGLRPDGLQPAQGDSYRLTLLSEEASVQLMVGSRFFDNRYSQKLFRTRGRSGGSSFFELLFWNPDAPEADFEELPLVRHFRVAGSVIARESWDFDNSTLFEMHSAKFQSGNHQHDDSGAFSLYYKAPLFLDSGIYDSYGTTHFYNYYQRTIAHNSVTIFDPAERYIVYGTTYSNEGGQKGTSGVVPSVPDVMPGGRSARKGITRYETRPELTYIQADVSDAYDASKVDPQGGAVRSYVWLPQLPGFKHPALFLHDEIHKTTAKAGLTTRVLFHTAEEPAPLGGEHLMTCRWKAASNHFVISNGGGVAELETLWPVDAVVQKVGGFDGTDDCRFLAWDITGKETNYPPLTTKDPKYTTTQIPNFADIGSWRLEVSPPTPTKDEQFLHFMAVRDEGDTVPRALSLPVTGGVGAALGSTLFVFADNQDSISVATPLIDALWVFGLAPDGHYTVTYDGPTISVAGSTAGTAVASDQGVLLVPRNPCLNVAAELTVTPSEVSLLPGETQTFTASARDCEGNSVDVTPTWTAVAAAGSIDEHGVFTAGENAGTYPQGVQAMAASLTSAANITITANDSTPQEPTRRGCGCSESPFEISSITLVASWLWTRRRRKN